MMLAAWLKMLIYFYRERLVNRYVKGFKKVNRQRNGNRATTCSAFILQPSSDKDVKLLTAKPIAQQCGLKLNSCDHGRF